MVSDVLWSKNLYWRHLKWGSTHTYFPWTTRVTNEEVLRVGHGRKLMPIVIMPHTSHSQTLLQVIMQGRIEKKA